MGWRGRIIQNTSIERQEAELLSEQCWTSLASTGQEIEGILKGTLRRVLERGMQRNEQAFKIGQVWSMF